MGDGDKLKNNIINFQIILMIHIAFYQLFDKLQKKKSSRFLILFSRFFPFLLQMLNDEEVSD